MARVLGSGYSLRAGPQESFVLNPKELRVGIVTAASWHRDSSTMQSLNAVDQRWSILLLENVWPYLHHIVRSDTHEIPVERAMVQLAESKPVRDNRFTTLFIVGNDVSRVEQFFMSETAERALVPVGSQDAFPEGPLVKALAHSTGDILASYCITAFVHCQRTYSGQACVSRIVHCNRKCQPARIVSNDKYRPGRNVPPGHDSMEVDERQPLLHCES